MPIRVLVVEDQPKILKAQIKLLETYPDIEIVGSALSGETALEEVEKTQPEVILCDLGLPQMSGIDVTRQVKAKYPHIEILIFTIFDEEEKVIEAITAGAAGYLLKGAPREELFRAIRVVYAGGSLLHPVVATKLLRHMSGPPAAETLTERGGCSVVACWANTALRGPPNRHSNSSANPLIHRKR